jgi:hypothetical protein
MFPITKKSLSFLEISNYWSREIQPRASQNELLKCLESAWWLDEIHGDSALSRLEFLKRMFKSMQYRDDVGIVFIAGSDIYKAPEKYLPDGSALVTVKHQIPLPSSDTDTWDDCTCADAFQALAETSSVESYPEMTASLAYIELTYDEFIGWLTKRRMHKPEFWQPYNVSPPVALTELSDRREKLAGRVGRPPLDWSEARDCTFYLMDYHGEFETADPEWNAQARLEEEIRKLPRYRDCAESTIREHVGKHLDEWRKQKRSSSN